MTQSRFSFSDVGRGYTRRHDDLEEARETFHDERHAILSALARTESTALKAAPYRFTEEYPRAPGAKDGAARKDVNRWTWVINAQYSEAWNADRKKAERKPRRSGVTLCLSRYVEDQPFGFFALLWFYNEGRTLVDDDAVADGVIASSDDLSKALCRRCGVVPEHIRLYTRRELNVVTSFIRASDEGAFKFDVFAEQASRLPQLFRQADEYLAELFTARAAAKE
jgi:hypothetical protein